MNDLDIELLDGLPPLGPVFARALIPRPRREPAMPRTAVMVAGLKQDRDRFSRYSQVCGFTLKDAVPPTWLHVLTFPLHVHLLSSPGSTMRAAGMVHVSNSMRLHRTVSVAEPLDLRVHAANLRPHRRGALVDMLGEVRVADEVVWDGVSTYLMQGATLPGEPEKMPREEFAASTPSALWRLEAGLGKRYRAVSGDPNPIHTSRIAARAFGFSRPIIHGMWTHARTLAALENRLPEEYEVAVSFTKPILLPATIGFRAESRGSGWRAAVTDRDGTKPYLLARIDAEGEGWAAQP